jgi:glucosylceramidase
VGKFISPTVIFFFLLSLSTLAGCGSSGGNGGTEPVLAPPILSPQPGTFSTSQSVTLSDSHNGATIYYTTDGTTPTTASSVYSAAIPVKVDTTVNALAVANGYNNSTVASGSYLIAGPTVNVTLSTHDQTNLLTAQPTTLFTLTTTGSNKILVDESLTYQPIDGFGAAFTDSANWLLYTQAQPAQYTSIMSDLFTRSGSGIGLNFMRIPMGASDLARSVYSYDDMPANQTDPSLANFSIAHDQAYIIPVIQQATTLNPNLKLMANPWSPPGWMKSTDTMIGGTLLSADYTPFANYFVDYIKAYSAAGVNINYITLQNEPLNNPATYPSMGMDANTQLSVLRDYVLPALTSNNLTAQVLVYDHNWDTPGYPETVLADPTIAASPLVAGTAWHGYSGTPGVQQTVENMFPAKGTWETEHSGGTWVNDQFTSDFVEITEVLRNSARAYVKWSLALDQTLGPNLGELNQGYGGCTTCTPLVTVNTTNGNVTKDVEFYTLGQYSKFVLPGAQRIYSSNANSIVSTAFINPDGSKALVCFNNSSNSTTFQVQWGTENFSYTLPALGAVTFTWSGTQNGSTAIAATSVIQASSYTVQSGLQTEATSDTNGGYDLGYVTNSAYAAYENVDFGNGVTGVNVRTASGGNGGTLEFHLDSPTGALISNVSLPVTGGWQIWQTVNANSSGATGIHTLYAVFSGTGSIANLNWFQFQ